MTTFDKRKDAFENKFAHDEEFASRRSPVATSCSAFGLPVCWARPARRPTPTPSEVIASDFEKAGEEDVFAKIRGDFDAAGVAQSDHQIRRTMDELMQTAMGQIASEG